MGIINVKKFEYQNWGGINMEFRNSMDSDFGRVRYDLYDKRREMEGYWWLEL